MTQMNPGPLATPPIGRHASPENDIYTVLALVALLVLAIGIGYLWYRSSVLFNTVNPFEVVASPGWMALHPFWG